MPGALTREIKNPKSPVYRFLTERFGNTKQIARDYRQNDKALSVQNVVTRCEHGYISGFLPYLMTAP